MKIAIHHRFTIHYTDLNLNLSTFLDPRFKTKFIEEIFTIDQILKALAKGYRELKEKSPDLYNDFSKMEESFKKENSKIAKIIDKNVDEDFWQEFEISNMLSISKERKDIE